jgi:hypothetical protein
MYELPPDLERLWVIRVYLQMQLAAVDAKIQQVEKAAAPPPEPPAELGWRLQHVPNPDGETGHGVVHRDSCRIKGGGRLDRKALDMALAMPDVTTCSICNPERGLDP